MQMDFLGDGRRMLARVALVWALGAGLTAFAADSLQWRADTGRVDAEITSWKLPRLLQDLASVTGWHIYVEPGSRHEVSTKFNDRPVGDALRLLLGDLSFALVPQSGGPSRLYVFSTAMSEATQLVKPVEKKIDPTAKPIPNELVVTVKPGTDIEELAKKLGAKVIGRSKEENTYRLQFDDATATEAARTQLREDPNVESVDNNYNMWRPDSSQGLQASNGGTPALEPKAPDPDCNRPIIGLIDTAIQPTGTKLDEFLLPSLSVAGDAKLRPDQPSHGTSMFETVLRGLAVNGRQTTAKILPVDVYGSSGTTTTFDVANGIVQAVNAGANAVNMSLGSAGDSQFLHDVIKKSQKQGVLFFGAAGNEPTTAPSYPAAYPEVVAVTAGQRDGSIAPYANRGDFVDVAAPGSSIVTFNGQQWVVMGTSAATAFTTGLAASMIDCEKRSTAQIISSMQTLLPFKK
jgi:hypothetical protein